MVLVLSEVYSRLVYDVVETTNHTACYEPSCFITDSIWTVDINSVSHLWARVQGDPIAATHHTLQNAQFAIC
jgi:hypothetical protein